MKTKRYKNLKQKITKSSPFRDTFFVEHDHPYKPKKDKFKEYRRKH